MFKKREKVQERKRI